MIFTKAFASRKFIRRKGWKYWCEPRFIDSIIDSSLCALPTACGSDSYTIVDEDLIAEDWEIHTTPMKFEFECLWINGTITPTPSLVDVDDFVKLRTMANSGKNFRVICEEIIR